MDLAIVIGDEPPIACAFGREIRLGEEFVEYDTAMIWSEEERNARGLFTIVPAAPPPAGQVIASLALECFEGGVRRVATYQQAAPTRRLIPKSVIQERLIDADLLDDVFEALEANRVAYVRWFAPNHPNVFADDEAMVQLLTAVGADVAAITAPA
jgi:hypothetical protein